MSTTFYSDLKLMHGAFGGRPKAKVRLSNRDYYCLQYNHAGTIGVQIDDEPPRTVQGPSLLITGPGHRFVFGSEEGWHHNYIAFTGPRVVRYIETGFLPVDRPLQTIRDSQTFYTTFEQCVRALRRKSRLEAKYAFEGLLMQIQKRPKRKEEPDHHRQIRELAESMREMPLEDYDLDQEAEWIHISTAHLRRLFRQLVGESPGQYLQQCRLSVAADRLSTTRDPVKQIAADCRLGGVHYFTRLFRNQYGQPPARFRRETLGD